MAKTKCQKFDVDDLGVAYLHECGDWVPADVADGLYGALAEARDEIAAFPRSMGYDITTLPKIDAALAAARGESQEVGGE